MSTKGKKSTRRSGRRSRRGADNGASPSRVALEDNMATRRGGSSGQSVTPNGQSENSEPKLKKMRVNESGAATGTQESQSSTLSRPLVISVNNRKTLNKPNTDGHQGVESRMRESDSVQPGATSSVVDQGDANRNPRDSIVPESDPVPVPPEENESNTDAREILTQNDNSSAGIKDANDMRMNDLEVNARPIIDNGEASSTVAEKNSGLDMAPEENSTHLTSSLKSGQGLNDVQDVVEKDVKSPESQSKKSWTWSENTDRSKFMAKMFEHCTSLKDIFTRKSVSTCIASSMMDSIFKVVKDKDILRSADLSLILNLILFGKQQNSNKNQCFTSQVGMLASEFRRKAMKNCILHLMKGYVPDSNMVVKHSDLLSRSDLKWLHKVVPTEVMCLRVSNQKEKKGVKKFRKEVMMAIGEGRRDPSDSEITEFVLNQLYSIIVSSLNINRKSFKPMFFGRVGYLIEDWDKCKFTDIKKDVAAMWLQACTGDVFAKPSQIPDAKTLLDGPKADEINEKAFQSFLETRKEMMLTVEHQVNIRSNGTSRASSSKTAFVSQTSEGETRRPFRRMFSVLGVALSMLSELCDLTSDQKKIQVLKYHRKSIVVCYILAILVKRMLQVNRSSLFIGEPDREEEECVDGMGYEGIEEGNTSADNSNVCDSLKFVFDDETDLYLLSMMAIVPPERKRILDRVVGNVWESYWVENHIGGTQPREGEVQRNDHAGKDVAEEDEDVGAMDMESLEVDM